jgi:diketogulonate reductase-like aldo/keto reductase
MPCRRDDDGTLDRMVRRRFGNAGFDVPVLGQGSWHIEQDPRPDAIRALRRGLDLGLTHIDTAEMYGAGAAETLIAEAIAGRRDEVVLVSKVLPEHASRKGTVAACEASLARLRTDRLDCYLLHWPGEHPLEDTVDAFEELRRQGKIRAWGVSNFDVADLDAVWRLAGARLACNQVLYHLQERAVEHAVMPWCEQHGVAVVAYSPFGSGAFPGPRSKGGRVLQAIAEAHGGTPRQVALAFLLERAPVFAIPKAGRREHVEENAAAASLQLAPADLARIERAFPRGRRPRELPTL